MAADFNWAVYFGDQPTAEYWSILGENDRALRDGTGFSNGAIGNTKLASSWTSYTPTVTVDSGTAPTYTNAATSGKYSQIGKIVTLQFFLYNTTGGTAGSGTGAMHYSLPVSAVLTKTGASTVIVGSSQVNNGAQTNFNFPFIDSANTLSIVNADTATVITGGQQNSTTRFVRVHAIYEVA